MEIDDYQNYEKALDALADAIKCLSKAKQLPRGQQEQRLAELQQKINLIKKFVHIRRYDYVLVPINFKKKIPSSTTQNTLPGQIKLPP